MSHKLHVTKQRAQILFLSGIFFTIKCNCHSARHDSDNKTQEAAVDYLWFLIGRYLQDIHSVSLKQECNTGGRSPSSAPEVNRWLTNSPLNRDVVVDLLCSRPRPPLGQWLPHVTRCLFIYSWLFLSQNQHSRIIQSVWTWDMKAPVYQSQFEYHKFTSSGLFVCLFVFVCLFLLYSSNALL